jgi:hypothetical protein
MILFPKKSASLRDYLFVDEKMLSSYIEQISSEDVEEKSRSSKMGVSLSGPQFERAEATARRKKTTTEKIDELVAFLKQEGMLGEVRPNEMYDYQQGRKDMPPFFRERTVAKKVILPSDSLKDLKGVNQLAVWISDPDPRSIIPEDQANWEFRGSFLYLTELHLDNGGFHTVYSGCSALQAVANAATGLKLIDRTAAGEPLGRGNYKHPIEKLASYGAIVGDEREIDILYRIRYMTNEQCFSKDGNEYRVNDILGYPIYIAQQLST